MRVPIKVNGVWQQEIVALVSEARREALLSNGHIACIPTVKMGLDHRIFEVAICRTSVKAMGAAADWCDRDAVPEEEQ